MERGGQSMMDHMLNNFEILKIATIVITNAYFYWKIGNKRFLVGVESAPEAHAAAKNSEQADPVPRCARSA